MRNNHHMAIHILSGQFIHRLHHAVMEDLRALSAFHSHLRIECQPLGPRFRILELDFLCGQSFENTVALLLQTRI